MTPISSSNFALPSSVNRPSFWRMCLGKHHLSSSTDVTSAEKCYEVDGIIKHEGFVYEQHRTDITNDIALVHLVEPVAMTKEISPICLPRVWDVTPAGTPCFVTGWGDKEGVNWSYIFYFLSVRYSRFLNFRNLRKLGVVIEHVVMR